MAITVTFHGACGIVTGSCFEVRTSRAAVLVDCGMFQGTKTVKELNYGPFLFAPSQIDAAVVTHAHIDHCGLLPKLVRAGFKGSIYATPATSDLLTYVLPDSGYIQEMEVERLNRRNRQRGKATVEPIYTRSDAEACLKRLKHLAVDSWIPIADGIAIRLWDAGHILGSTSVEILASDKGTWDDTSALRLLFSGDIGPGEKSLQKAPQAPSGVDYLFAESTYGDRIRQKHTQAQRRSILCKEIRAGLEAGGAILIPAFAVERTQELLFDLSDLFDAGELPPIPVFVDSPLATKATGVFAKHLNFGTGNRGGGHHPFKRSNLRFVEDASESRKLDRLRGGAIILAGSGMCDAGRIRHHLKNNLSQANATVLLVGYQAPGTLGRFLKENAPSVRIEGDEVAVRARIRMLDEYSGHADQAGLIEWIRARLPVSQNIFLIHAEDPARDMLAAQLMAVGIPKSALLQPLMGETVRLTRSGAKTTRVRPRVTLASAVNRDWHNAYAKITLDLRRKLEAMPNDKAREAFLDQVGGLVQR